MKEGGREGGTIYGNGCKERITCIDRELNTIYPYGLNDNVKGVGGVSKCKNMGILQQTN